MRELCFSIDSITQRFLQTFHAFEFWRAHSVASAFDHLVTLKEICNSEDVSSPFGQNRGHKDHLNAILRGTKSGDLPSLSSTYRQLFQNLVLDLQIYLGSRESKLEVINRFKSKVMWYRKDEYRELANVIRPGKTRREREDRLALIMAEYLFDAGYPVFVKAVLDNQEPDLLGMNHPLLVEAKISTKSYTQDYILAGLAQTYSYLNNLTGTAMHVNEAFYVVFRFDGKTYEFPTAIETGRFTIYPVVVDLGTAHESGNQADPAVIIDTTKALQFLERYTENPEAVEQVIQQVRNSDELSQQQGTRPPDP